MSAQRISDAGAKIASSRLGITVDEYRRHENAGEKWCPRCLSWQPRPEHRTQAYCDPCRRAIYRRGTHYAGPAFSGGAS